MELKAEITDVSFDARGRQRITFTLERRVDVSGLLGKALRLVAKVWRRKRSLNANAYFFTLCQKIAEKTAQSLTETHNQMIADYGQPEIIHEALVPIILRESIDWRRLDSMHLRPTGRHKTMDDGKLYGVYLLMRGSHTYDTREMSRLITGTIREAEALQIGKVTSMFAAVHLGITSLHRRLTDLREMGYTIGKARVSKTDETGKEVSHWYEYWLA